ncbi:hypothetical protein KJ713_01180 [Patescibacteria group bacterium]|nr:hypothetical protein [Patescibacteria group bacterium]
MSYQHKELAGGRWFEFSLIEQMANIGSEVYRAINWRKKGDNNYAMMAFERALELFDLTVEDPKNRTRLKEVLRARELFCDYFVGDNQYHSTAKSWQNYFYSFNYAARLNK